MSDVATALMSGPEIMLRPEEILIDARFDIRRYSDENPDEIKKVERLSRTIEQRQLDAGVVISNGSGKFILYAGHRRRKAIILANERRSQAGQSLLKMRVVVDSSGLDPLRAAIQSNMQRENLSPMELANLIKRVRKENDWSGFPGAKKVADYMGIDITTVTQHERFHTAAPEIREALHNGSLTPQGAFSMMNVKKPEVADVLEKAKEQQKRINKRSLDAKAAKGEVAESQMTSEEVQQEKEAAPIKITQPAIIAAIRETPEAVARVIPMTRKEIIEFFMELDGPAYGFMNGATRQFLDYFCNSLCPGRGDKKKALKKFDAMCANADQGTQAKADKAADALESPADNKTATGRLKRVDAGIKKEKPVKEVKAVKEKPSKAASKKEAGKKPAKKAAKSKPTVK